MPYIDAHLHFLGDHPQSLQFLEALDVKFLNICVAFEADDSWRSREAEPYARQVRAHPDRFAWCTTFTPPLPTDEPKAYISRCLAALARDLDEGGAVACKVWKNIGMGITDAQGRHVMVDDPLFEPLFAFLASRNVPLLGHIAEPLVCWQPVGSDSPHAAYYRDNPQWHMHGRTDMPTHAQLMAARDNVAARHPNLRVVGAHLGSLEYSLQELGQRFDRFPNFFVDTSGRLEDLMVLDQTHTRQFMIDYQDRILFGTDVGQFKDLASLDAAARSEILQKYQQFFECYRRYFGTDEEIHFAGRRCRGLNLPASVFQKIMHDNARRVYPGL